jgi:hypothetical protein
MNADWAAQNLQTIRTLMERSALYRRALAPIMLTVGCIGLASAVLAYKLEINEPVPFILWWLVTAIISCGTALFLVRKQAISAHESVWSPPARRVVQAAAPPLAAGLIVSLVLLMMIPGMPEEPSNIGRAIGTIWLPLGWVILYGCAIHAAGFFLPRGMKIFGWTFILGGCLLFAGGFPDLPPGMYAHGIMGLFFGLLHQAYGIYLYITEKKELSA